MASSRERRHTQGFGRALWAELRALAMHLWWPVVAVLALLTVGAAVLWQRPLNVTVDIGTPSDEAYTRNFHARSDGENPDYRWSDVYGYVVLPGTGGGRPFTLDVTLDTARPAEFELFVNGERFLRESAGPGWRTVQARVDEAHPASLASRDLVVELRATDYRTEDNPAEPKGLKVDRVSLAQDAQGPLIVPALAPLAWCGLAVLGLFLLASAALSPFAAKPRVRFYGMLAATMGAAGALLLIYLDRVFFAAAAGHIATTVWSALGLVVLGRAALGAWTAVPERVAAALAGVMAGAFALRFGGMALPQAVIVDMPWHMKWLRTLLAGDWQSLYFPGGLSSVPREWGMEILIPKSPLFYFLFAPLGTMPFDLATLTKWLICVLDSSLVVVVYALAKRLRADNGSALLAAAVYALMPLAFRAFAYGILPTILAQWLCALLFLAVVSLMESKRSAGAWAVTTALAALTLLAFPTVALFASLTLGAYALFRAFDASGRGPALRVGAALAAGWAIALVAYYGLYVEPVAASVSALLAPRAGSPTTVRWEGGPPELVKWTADYVVSLLPYILAGCGLLLLPRRGTGGEGNPAKVLLLCWAAILPLFVIVNYRVDMIGKHLFFTLIPVAVGGGLALMKVARLGRWGVALASSGIALVAWQAIIFWIERLVRAST